MNSDFLPQRNQPQNKPFQPRQNNHLQDFQTPDQVAAQEHTGRDINTSVSNGVVMGSGQAPKQKRSFKEWLRSLTKKQWIIIILAIILLLGGGAFALYHFVLKDEPQPVKKTVVQEQPAPPAPQPIFSKLSGLPITDAAINDRPVTAVMIENSLDARPQAGLSQASVVFEAIAEGGITRFLTLFQDQEPDYIGPVRSVRPYYIQWLAGFDAAVAHVGGSAEALAMLKRGEAKDLDQFANPGPYRRVSNRTAPHNMYSNVTLLRELQEKKGFKSNYTGFSRKAESASATPNATSIDFNISSANYNAHFDYDASTNSYKRSEGGKPHNDERSGQLSPKVVVAMTMQQGKAGVYTVYNAVGSGEVHVFQDGIITKGTWSKAGAKEQILFKDASGAELKLNPGQTWITALGGSNRITYR